MTIYVHPANILLLPVSVVSAFGGVHLGHVRKGYSVPFQSIAGLRNHLAKIEELSGVI
ncbi:hypothetical protein [Thermoflavimicrobium dichotomicum]|uniref:Uncharacterized protein n=1 Tax=Thermoflavimicrobium dichotomicum TaxID=46223 RepID=A0A1I3MZH4_9BACL|nr:hypothetical protein [Thermoflavimicrobium dichotomicum]SFJ02408.1 hypothetical protein SAMN05421852_103268 [Thermoflavimicrobium dichotomicum]